MDEIGALLRERREALGLSLSEVERATRIRQKYLSALEADEWHLLPGEVVGRGFLYNYAAFLKLDAEMLKERRRVTVDPYLAEALSSTSAGASLPPSRPMDYRPKDVSLTRDTIVDFEEMEVEPRRLIPYVALALVLGLIGLGWWGLPRLSAQLGLNTASAGQSPTAVVSTTGSGNGDSVPATSNTAAPGGEPAQAAAAPTYTPTATLPPPPTDTPVPPTDTPLPPTDTPVPPTATPIPLVPTATAVPPPTDTPEPQVVAPACPDGRASITTPGVRQEVSGVVAIQGSARHDDFWYYKLEFAPGADAGGGFVYFDGSENQVANGTLAFLNTPALANGLYTIRLTVVDATGNFPPPCDVTINVQN